MSSSFGAVWCPSISALWTARTKAILSLFVFLILVGTSFHWAWLGELWIRLRLDGILVNEIELERVVILSWLLVVISFVVFHLAFLFLIMLVAVINTASFCLNWNFCSCWAWFITTCYKRWMTTWSLSRIIWLMLFKAKRISRTRQGSVTTTQSLVKRMLLSLHRWQILIKWFSMKTRSLQLNCISGRSVWCTRTKPLDS